MLNQEDYRVGYADEADGLRILIVEDQRDCAETEAKLLRLFGHDVEIARDGKQAIEAAHFFKPDVVLLDIGLPVMDGYEVARQLSAINSPPPLMIAVTGYGREIDRQRAADAGIHLHLLKPLDHRELVLKLRKFQRYHSQRQPLREQPFRILEAP